MKNLINRVNAIIDAASAELSKKQRVAGVTREDSRRNLVANGNCSYAASTSYIKRVKMTLNDEETIVEVDLRKEPDLWWLECKPHLKVVGFDIRWQGWYIDLACNTVDAMIAASFEEHIDGGDFGDVIDDIIYFKGVVSHAKGWDSTLKEMCMNALKYYLKQGKSGLRKNFNQSQSKFYKNR